jgi:pimeloyl-ACP methyl ester carboxylesterase
MRVQLLLLLLALIGLPASSAHSQTLSDGFWISDGYEREPRLGPDKAKGVVIYNHGIQLGESFGAPLAPYLRLVQRDGWDIVRLNRKWAWDRHYDSAKAVAWAADVMRQQGYRRIVLAGQSRGAWLAVMAASQVHGIHAVVSTAPGGYGDGNIGNIGRSAQQLADMLEDIKGARTMLFFFSGDVRENVPGGRGEPSRRALARAGVASVVINEPAGLDGHGAASSGLFARRYGECIVRFIAPDPTPADFACDTTRGLAAGADVKVPASAVAADPAAAPAPLRAFAGSWYGEYLDGAARRLIVTRLEPDGTAEAFYAGAPAPHRADAPFGRRVQGKLADGAMVFPEKAGTLRVKPRGDGRLDLTWQPAGDGKTLSTVLRRGD